MVQITIPDKTFELYKTGRRTYLHVSREELQDKELNYGDKVLVLNKTGSEQMELVFSFKYDFEGLDFIFLVFWWNTQSAIFFTRKNYRDVIIRGSTLSHTEASVGIIEAYSNRDKRLYHAVAACSAMFFITEDVYLETQSIKFKINDKIQLPFYSVVDILTLKTGHRVMSLFHEGNWQGSW